MSPNGVLTSIDPLNWELGKQIAREKPIEKGEDYEEKEIMMYPSLVLALKILPRLKI